MSWFQICIGNAVINNMGSNMSNQKGFTLVELVVVIAVLGILSATALPRFINVSANARVSSGMGLAGSVSSATNMARALFKAQGLTAAATISMDGQNVTVNASGFPTADAAGITAALQNNNVSSGVAYAAGVATYTVANKATCTFTYTEATGVVNTAALTAANCG